MFAPDELIAALADAGVDYVLIGGLAVGAHGYPLTSAQSISVRDGDVTGMPFWIVRSSG